MRNKAASEGVVDDHAIFARREYYGTSEGKKVTRSKLDSRPELAFWHGRSPPHSRSINLGLASLVYRVIALLGLLIGEKTSGL